VLTGADVHQRIAEFAATRPDAGGDPVAQVEVALFVEEVFDLPLTDDEMNQENLGSHQALERFVLGKLGVK
jgi:hypothetical protein